MTSAIPYGRQEITQQDIDEVVRVLKSDYLTQGPEIEAFEKAFADYVGSRFAVAVANGTAALHLSALALGVGPGQQVITSPITFSASANCVRYCGGEVMFADIDPESYCLSPKAVRTLLEGHPKGTFQGIIPVDFTGYPAKLDSFRELADEFGLWLIEDACHAPGGSLTGASGDQHRCGDGSLAELAIFSFHPVKHIAAGEGGMITTNDPELFQKLSLLRTHGISKDPDLLRENHGPWYYEMLELGYNYRLTDMQAALGRSQLSRAAAGLERRRAIARRYDQAFADLGIVKQLRHPGHAYHLYVVELENRSEVYQALREQQIFAQVHYIPVHRMPYYRELGWEPGSLPVANSLYESCLSLPMYPSLSDSEVERVISSVRAAVNSPTADLSGTPAATRRPS